MLLYKFHFYCLPLSAVTVSRSQYLFPNNFNVYRYCVHISHHHLLQLFQSIFQFSSFRTSEKENTYHILIPNFFLSKIFLSLWVIFCSHNGLHVKFIIPSAFVLHVIAFSFIQSFCISLCELNFVHNRARFQTVYPCCSYSLTMTKY